MDTWVTSTSCLLWIIQLYHTQISLHDSAFNSFGSIPRSIIARSYGNSIFSFLRKPPTIFHSSYTIKSFHITHTHTHTHTHTDTPAHHKYQTLLTTTEKATKTQGSQKLKKKKKAHPKKKRRLFNKCIHILLNGKSDNLYTYSLISTTFKKIQEEGWSNYVYKTVDQ